MSILFGKKLIELRKDKKLSQSSLSEKLQCSQSIICEWERGAIEPTEVNIKKIASFFEVTTDFLLGLEDDFGNRASQNIVTSDQNKSNVVITTDECELLTLWRKLPTDKRNNFLQLLK